MDNREFYDLLAKDYEQENEFWDNPYDREVWRLEHELLRPSLQLSCPLLDLACGFYPHDNFGPSMRIIAADISICSLLVAREHLSDKLICDFVVCDAHSLPFSCGSFQQAIAGGELFNHVDYHKVSAELARIIRPNGVLLIAFGAKWCMDSLWAMLDSTLGHRIGYSATKEEVRSFWRFDGTDADVTWGVTPRGTLRVKLLAVSNVRQALTNAGFEIEKVVSTNLVSGLIPLPWQQESDSRLLRIVSEGLIRLDHYFGHIPKLNLFAGNVFMLCKRV